MLPVVLVPTVMALAHRIKKREWQHKERMRAIELGMPVPDQDARLGGATVTAIGAGVPLASVFVAFFATSSISEHHEAYLEVLAITWGCATMISAGAFITSLVLGLMLMRSRKPAGQADSFAMKPAYEPDAYDVVSTRG